SVSDTDDNRSSRMAFSDMSERLGGITQRVSCVDDRCDLAGFDELLQDEQVRSVGKFDGRTQLPALEHRHCGRLEDGTDGAEPTAARRSVVGLQLPLGVSTRLVSDNEWFATLSRMKSKRCPFRVKSSRV